MKKLLTAGALLVASSSAFAGTYTESGEFGVQGSVLNQAITSSALNTEVTIAGFDTSLGNLTGVEITVYGQIDSAGQSTNTSNSSGQSTYEFFLKSDWEVTSAAGSYTFSGFGTLFEESDTDHGVGEVFDYGQVFEYKTGSIVPSDINTFLSDVNFVFAVDAINSFSNSTSGGDALFENKINSASWGKVEVAYTFDDVVASVPETGSLAIFGLGLAGFALSRKAKKAA